jgi:large subunit ribosomal protein L13
MTTTKTYRLSAKEIDRAWHVIDAGGKPLGRVASEAAKLLLGKHKPTYEPHLPMGDHVIVLNAKDVALTGRKPEQKLYYRHSGYPGGLKTRSFEEQLARDPRRILERAVRGMLPHNSLGRELFRHLKVYSDAKHPHASQLNAGTGERARKTAAREEREAAARSERPATMVASAPAAAASAPGARLSGSLAKYKRSELDDEARRLGIAPQTGWTKPDVVAAIQANYDENPVEGGSSR